MRRMAALAVLGTLFFAAAGCTGRGESTGGAQPAVGGGSTAAAPAPAGPSGASPAVPALSGHNQQICDQAVLAGTDFGDVYIADLKLQIDAAAQGAAAKTRAQRKVTQDVRSYSSALAGLAKAATDPALKKALTRMSTEVMALKGDVAKIDTDRMSALSDTLEAACDKG